MKEPKISLNDEVVYSVDLVKKEIRVRTNAGGDVVLFRDVRVGKDTRYKLAMRMLHKDTSTTITQLPTVTAQEQLQVCLCVRNVQYISFSLSCPLTEPDCGGGALEGRSEREAARDIYGV